MYETQEERYARYRRQAIWNTIGLVCLGVYGAFILFGLARMAIRAFGY